MPVANPTALLLAVESGPPPIEVGNGV